METNNPALGLAHLLAQSDAVGKTLLAVLLLMVCVHGVVLPKAIAHIVCRLHRCPFGLAFSRSARQPHGLPQASSWAAPCWR